MWDTYIHTSIHCEEDVCKTSGENMVSILSLLKDSKSPDDVPVLEEEDKKEANSGS